MHLLYVHKATDSVQYLLFYLYIFLLPLMLYDILYLYHSTLLLLSDPHIAWINSTFPTHLCNQLQNLYSDALSDTKSLTRMHTSILAQASYQDSRYYLDVILANPSTTWVPSFIAPLQTRYRSHTCLLQTQN